MTYVFPAMTDGLLVGGSRHYPLLHSTVKNIIPQHKTKPLIQREQREQRIHRKHDKLLQSLFNAYDVRESDVTVPTEAWKCYIIVKASQISKHDKLVMSLAVR